MLLPVQMLASEVYSLLRAPASTGSDAAVRKVWLASQTKPCKDAVALALPLRRVPTTLDAFRQAVADNGKGSDWVISSWYVVYVGAADGREWGWSNAPYDTKKRLTETKPLYSTDATGANAGQTRFWSFKKVSNNMNKGPRVERVENGDGEDLSFVLPAGTTFSHFLREDNYGDKPLFCDGDGQEYLEAYSPVLLQLSSTNCEQAAKGNGLKLRRVLRAPTSILNSFCDKFYTRKAALDEAQERACKTTALTAMAKPTAGSPIAVKVDKNAFWFYDESAHIIELCDSGVDAEVGSKLFLRKEMLLQALNCVDIQRALRMLTVALGHGTVTCIVAVDKKDPVEVCRVVHLHIDTAETLWLGSLQKIGMIDCTELPNTSQLTMCFGTAINTDRTNGAVNENLQWFAPFCKVPMATEDGREVNRHIVFELMLEQQNDQTLREVAQKSFLMDGVAGQHYPLKVYQVESVRHEPSCGLVCEKPELLLSWQLRPGMGTDSNVAGACSSRKRQFVTADARDYGRQDQVKDGGKRVCFETTPEFGLPDIVTG